MFTKRFLHFLTKDKKNSNNSHQIKQLYASYEIHNLFDHSLKATKAKLSRERNEVTKCIGVQVSQLIYAFILYFTVKPNVYQNLIKLVFSLI